MLTKVAPELTAEDVEYYILEIFEEINDVYVRKKSMKNHINYATFVFIINSCEEVDVDRMKKHNWPGSVMCFLSPYEHRARF